MTWTYSGDPSSSKRDALRFEIGDINTNNQLYSDEELDYALTRNPSVLGSAADMCENLSIKYAGEADYVLGPMAVRSGQKSVAYAARALELRRRMSSKGVPFYQEPDAPPAFTREMMDNKGGAL